MKLTKKLVKFLKESIIAEITDLIVNHQYCTIITSSEWDETLEEYDFVPEVLIVDKHTEWLPHHWQAGISSVLELPFNKNTCGGVHWSIEQFASEEAVRAIRDMFPDDQAGFITWAFYAPEMKVYFMDLECMVPAEIVNTRLPNEGDVALIGPTKSLIKIGECKVGSRVCRAQLRKVFNGEEWVVDERR